ncbi:uncharacterized protein [Spinacia oleracea]|uniref:ATP-dependent DNA helicase n=1 Tax=Spinacia oleracea TaxID=3562 RepID=A0A9R0JQS5_SPIOL|nr:uncharacterized protein LOC110783488 isoform X2 [Spinacia oleracea]
MTYFIDNIDGSATTTYLSDNQTQNYCLCEIEKILDTTNRSLREFPTIPYPEPSLMQQTDNPLIIEEQMYDANLLGREAFNLEEGLNVQQKEVYQAILQATHERAGGLFFVYGSGGTGKTYLWRTLTLKLRSEHRIVIAVASSGIAALLLPSGKTAHSAFCIPIHIHERSCCRINQGSNLALFIAAATLIIWDEALMVHRHAFEAVDRTFRDIMQVNNPAARELVFGGKTVVLGGDFTKFFQMCQGNEEEILLMHPSVNRPLYGLNVRYSN